MPLLGKDMMITSKIIEKAEEEEEDSDYFFSKNDQEEYDDDFDFDQYQDADEELEEAKKPTHSTHLSASLKKYETKKDKCEVWGLFILSSRMEKHKEECNLPQEQKFVLDVKPIKFSERVLRKRDIRFANNDYSDSWEEKASEKEPKSLPKRSKIRLSDFKIRVLPEKDNFWVKVYR